MRGETLSHYRILERIGAGGMGEVFVAEDTRLGRRVALKVLPAELAADSDRLERFRREARAAAAISHPGVVTLYAVEEAGGVHFLTMELVEGETLDRQVPPGGLPLPRFFEIAVPLAEAVAAAHARGVVHRDLKPGNVMLTAEGQVKVLDFGLARQQAAFAPGAGAPGATALPTEALLTHTGQVMGTPFYMSPEQVEGRPTDPRSDIFSLGVILHEMAVGERPFAGESAISVMSAILEREPPPVERVRPELPRALGRILRHCLEKKPERRFQTALDLANELRGLDEELAAERATAPAAAAPAVSPAAPGTDSRPTAPPGEIAAPGTRRFPVWRFAALLGAVAVAAAAVVALLDRGGREAAVPAGDTGAVRTLRQVTVSAAVEEHPAWSADGKRLAFAREVDGYFKIFELDLETGAERQLTEGVKDDIHPAFSPGGEALLFVRANRPDGKIQLSDPYAMHDYGDIWRLELATGELVKIASQAFHPAFSPDGERIAFYADWAGDAERIWVADALGRNPAPVTSDESEQISHLLPRWSPDGTKIVFQNNHWTTKFDIRVVNVESGEMHWVTDDAYTNAHPAWSADGRSIVFSSYRSGGMNLWRVPVDGDGVPDGPPEQLTTGAGADVMAAVAPGGAIAFAVVKANADIWRLPVDPATGRPAGEAEPLVVTTREDSRGAWSPDGRRVAFNSDRTGDMNLWLLSLEDGSTRQLTRGPGGDYQAHWSPDGSRLAFFSMRAGNADVWTVDVASGELAQLTDDPAIDLNPFYSPDGRWIAFQSDRGGRRELWVMDADGEEERQLTRNTFGGVHYLAWTGDSREIIFRGAEGGAWKVPVGGGEPIPVARSGGWHMTLSPDGTRILDNDHGALYVTRTEPEAEREKVFEFADPTVSIDYSVWSPDGTSVLFDRLEAEAGDIWMLEPGD